MGHGSWGPRSSLAKAFSQIRAHPVADAIRPAFVNASPAEQQLVAVPQLHCTSKDASSYEDAVSLGKAGPDCAKPGKSTVATESFYMIGGNLLRAGLHSDPVKISKQFNDAHAIPLSAAAAGMDPC